MTCGAWQVLQDLSDKQHPYIVSLHHSFQDDAHLYLVMDFVGGGDLFMLIESQERLPEEWAMIYSAELTLALEHVHAQDVIFRDLKPENVMVGVNGHVKLTDFGLSKKVDPSAGPMTRGSMVGTPEYMAPELLLAQPLAAATDCSWREAGKTREISSVLRLSLHAPPRFVTSRY